MVTYKGIDSYEIKTQCARMRKEAESYLKLTIRAQFYHLAIT
ncbi:hypothetical protein [Lachnotalea glycerini]|nr:hypothetical protein [Lachnotalea glycerini]